MLAEKPQSAGLSWEEREPERAIRGDLKPTRLRPNLRAQTGTERNQEPEREEEKLQRSIKPKIRRDVKL